MDGLNDNFPFLPTGAKRNPMDGLDDNFPFLPTGAFPSTLHKPLLTTPKYLPLGNTVMWLTLWGWN
jgi:hypothetical protein